MTTETLDPADEPRPSDAPESTLASAAESTPNKAPADSGSHPVANGVTQRRRNGGAPPGNKNAMTHGLRGAQLPKGCKGEEFAIYSFRRELRVALVAVRGAAGLSFVDEALVQTAMRHETRARLAARWLRMEKEPSLADRLSLLATISNATDSRDEIIHKLGITPNGKAIPSGGASIYGEDKPQ